MFVKKLTGIAVALILLCGSFFGLVNEAYGQNLATINEMKPEDMYPFYDGMAKFEKNGLYGFANKEGEVLIRPIFEDASSFEEGRCVVKANEKYGVIDKEGTFVINAVWDSVSSSQDEKGRRVVGKDGKYGMIDQNGNIIIEPQWDGLEPFSDGLARVMLKDENDPFNGIYGFINEAGNIVTEVKYKSLLIPSDDGYTPCQENGLWGLIDKTGNEIIPPKYDGGIRYNPEDETIFVIDNDIAYKCTLSGEIIAESKAILKDGAISIGVMSAGGLWNLQKPTENKIPVMMLQKEESGYTNTMCYLDSNTMYLCVFPTDYPWAVANPFKNNRAVVRIGGIMSTGLLNGEKGPYGAINEKGEYVVEPEYDYISIKEVDGKTWFLVEKNDMWGILDENGSTIVPIMYEAIYVEKSEERIRVKQGSRYGYINKMGSVVIPCMFEVAYDFNADENTTIAKFQGEWCCIDDFGNIIW